MNWIATHFQAPTVQKSCKDKFSFPFETANEWKWLSRIFIRILKWFKIIESKNCFKVFVSSQHLFREIAYSNKRSLYQKVIDYFFKTFNLSNTFKGQNTEFDFWLLCQMHFYLRRQNPKSYGAPEVLKMDRKVARG